MAGLSGRSILITGGAGFIGSHLAEALVPENDVMVFDDLSTGSRDRLPDEAEFFKGDVRVGPLIDRVVEDVDLVFHEAAIVSVERSIEDPVGCHEVTVDGTLNVLDAARRAGARVVIASSAAVYGHPQAVPIPEDAPKRPTSPYGLDKHSVDEYARLYTELYDLETVVLRYFNVYGPGQPAGDYSGVISVFLDRARRTEPLTVHGDGMQTRDFVHVDDVVQANRLAATTDTVGEAFNIGTGTATSIETLAETVLDVTDSATEIIHTEARPGDIDESQADISKAAETLGYEPQVDLVEGLSTLGAD